MSYYEEMTTAGDVGSSRGWLTQEDRLHGVWRWHAWVQAGSLSGPAMSDGEAQALARQALNALIDAERRRTTRSV